MVDLFNLERVHESKIQILTELFQTEDVKEIYNQERKILERDAKVETFIPMLVYRKVLERMGV